MFLFMSPSPLYMTYVHLTERPVITRHVYTYILLRPVYATNRISRYRLVVVVIVHMGTIVRGSYTRAVSLTPNGKSNVHQINVTYTLEWVKKTKTFHFYRMYLLMYPMYRTGLRYLKLFSEKPNGGRLDRNHSPVLRRKRQ